jgi:hypothetical protein
MRWYKVAKEKERLDAGERAEAKRLFGDVGCSFAKDEDGYYCYTHRCRSKSYEGLSDIPRSRVEFVESTG